MAGKYIHEASFNNIIVMTSLCVDISGLLIKQFASLCTLYIWNYAAHQQPTAKFKGYFNYLIIPALWKSQYRKDIHKNS